MANRFGTQRVRHVLMAGAALALLAGCGEKKPAADAPAKVDARAASVDAGSPLDKPFRLKDAEAIDVDALFGLFPLAVRPTYDKAEFDARLGATVITNLRVLDVFPGDEVSFDGFVAERAELYGVDMDAIDAVKAASDKGAAAPFQTVFEKVRLFGVQELAGAADEGADDDDADGSRSSLVAEAVELDRLRVRAGAANAQTPDGGDVARFFNAFDLGGLYFRNVVSTSANDEAGAEVAFSAPDFRLVGIGGGRLGAAVGRDLEWRVKQSPELIGDALGPQGAIFLNGPLRNFIAPADQRTTLKSLDWRGLDLSGLLDWGLKGERPPITATKLIDLGTMTATDAESFVDGRRVASIPRTTMSEAKFHWLWPSNVRVETPGALYDYAAYVDPAATEAIRILKARGLDRVKADGVLTYDWDPAKGGARLAADYTAPGFGSAAFGFDLAGLELKKIDAARAAGDAEPVAGLAEFGGLSIVLDDDAMLDALFELSALQTGGSAADLRKSAPAMLRMAAIQASVLNPRFGDYIDAVVQWIEKGGTLTVTAKPERPVPLAAVSQTLQTAPQTLPDVVNLTVKRTD